MITIPINTEAISFLAWVMVLGLPAASINIAPPIISINRANGAVSLNKTKLTIIVIRIKLRVMSVVEEQNQIYF